LTLSRAPARSPTLTCRPATRRSVSRTSAERSWSATRSRTTSGRTRLPARASASSTLTPSTARSSPGSRRTGS
jgi:hypothetical protein